MVGILLSSLVTLSSCITKETELIFADLTEQPELLEGVPRIAQNEVKVAVEKQDGTTSVVVVQNAGNYRLITSGNYAELIRVYHDYLTGKLVPKSE